MDDDAFRKVQAQFATIFADSGAGLVDDEELDPDDAPAKPSLAVLEASAAARSSAVAARAGRAERKWLLQSLSLRLLPLLPARQPAQLHGTVRAA